MRTVKNEFYLFFSVLSHRIASTPHLTLRQKEKFFGKKVFRPPLQYCRAQHYKLPLNLHLNSSLLEARHSDVDNKVTFL